MQRLRANPDSRVRSSELFPPLETPFSEPRQTARGLVSLPLFVIVFGFGDLEELGGFA